MIFSLIWGGGKSLTNNARYLSDYNNLFNYWYANYGRLQSTYELNDFWQHAFDTVKNSTYINAFFNAPYTDYNLQHINPTGGRAMSNMIMISSTSGIGIDTINNINLNITENVDDGTMTGSIINIENTPISVNNVEVALNHKSFTPPTYGANENSLLNIVTDIKKAKVTIDTLYTDKLIENVLRCKSVEEFTFKVNNTIKYSQEYSRLNHIILFANEDGPDNTNNMVLNVDLNSNRNYSTNVVLAANVDGWIRVMNAMYKIADHLTINVINPIRVGTGSGYGSLTITDTSVYTFCKSFDFYYDFQNRTDCCDLSSIANETNITSKSIHLKNLPSSLKSKYTAACFDIVNVIE